MNEKKMITIAALCALLAACGGGGGGGDTAAAAPAPAPSVAAATLVSSVPTPTYAAASEEMAAYTLLNSERERCGFGKLAQNAQIDLAARDHTVWRLTNNVIGHFQDASKPNGFTGRTAEERLAFRGYTDGRVNEATSVVAPALKSGMGSALTRNLLSAPYHAQALLDGYRDVGISVMNDIEASSTAITGPYVSVQFNVAYKNSAGPQLMAGDAIATYPCEGVTGALYALRAELPNPIPGRDLATSPVGHPIYIKVRAGNTLVVQSAQMVQASTGAAVALRPIINQASDPNGQIVTPSEGFILPDTPLLPSTAYRVTLVGTNNGVTFNKTFTFTTGSTL